MNNYEFCADFAAKRGRRVLDYGCGKGQIVELLLANGVDAYGCDVFFDGGSYRTDVPSSLVSEGRVTEMKDRIPFPDESFDVVVNNQVMEHVPDLNAVLYEIRRVLKPGGVVLSLFPDKGVWREGHCGVAFMHWWPKGSEAREWYSGFWRGLGFGSHPWLKDRRDWTRQILAYLDNWTHYRPYSEIRDTFTRHLSEPEHIEAEFFDARKPRYAWLPRHLKSFAVKKGAGLVFVCRKHR